jgi:hypothetical protein
VERTADEAVFKIGIESRSACGGGEAAGTVELTLDPGGLAARSGPPVLSS